MTKSETIGSERFLHGIDGEMRQMTSQSFSLSYQSRRELVEQVAPRSQTVSNSVPDGITAGPDGNLWFTEEAASQIGVVSRKLLLAVK